jgi:hypothetical protein
MLRNGDALYQGHEANAAHIGALQDRVQAHDEELGERAKEAMRESLRLDSAFTLYNLPFWQRVRWLVLGG